MANGSVLLTVSSETSLLRVEAALFIIKTLFGQFSLFNCNGGRGVERNFDFEGESDFTTRTDYILLFFDNTI